MFEKLLYIHSCPSGCELEGQIYKQCVKVLSRRHESAYWYPTAEVKCIENNYYSYTANYTCFTLPIVISL